MSFFEELKRRNVFRVGIAYLIGAWVLAQIAELLLDTFKAPEWTMQFIVVVLMIGFPVALFFAWAFEVTPEGMKREADVDRSQAVYQQNSHKLDRAILVILVLALAYFIWESRFHSQTEPEPVSESAQLQPAPATAGNLDITPATVTTAEENSVAVLPFLNMSSDPEQEYFSDGMTEEIINALVKVPGLSVPARTSVFAFKGASRDVRGIGRELNVAHVLEGSIRSQNNQVRITAQLIKVDDGFHLWSETFDRELSNIFKLQEEIAGSIAQVLMGELGLAKTVIKNQTSNMQAYDLYLKGRAELRSRNDVAKAITLFNEAIGLDPDFAPPYAARAIAYQVSSDTLEEESRALQNSREALVRDPNNVDILTALAASLRDTWQWAEAEQVFDQALAIDPDSSELLEDYAEFLASVGRFKEYLEVSERGNRIDPYLPPLTYAYFMALKLDGQFEKSVEIMTSMGMIWEGFYPDEIASLSTALASGDTTRVIDQIRSMNKQLPNSELREAAIALIQDEGNTEARNLLRTAISDRGQSEPMKDILVFTGDVDFILDSLVTNLRTTGASDTEAMWRPEFRPLHQHPRWEEVLNIVKLPDYWDKTSWPEYCRRNNDGRISCS